MTVGGDTGRPGALGAGLREELVRVRRHLHAHPELGRAEEETTRLLLDRLSDAGLQPRSLSCGTGVLCDVTGTGPAPAAMGSPGVPVVALRADIDALPVTDVKDVPYRSTRPGLCHACGHDVHTSVLLGCALTLAARRASFAGTVRCVFQPAEELSTGALDVIADGALDGVRAMYALHCDPHLDVGRLGVRVGPITGSADVVELTLHGPGGHTARPHLTADLVYAISRVVTDLPGAMSRLVDPRAGVSLVFGAIAAGSAANVIPGTATARGTLRTLDRDVWEGAPKLVERLVESVLSPWDVLADLDYRRGTPPVVNDEEATAVMARAAAAALGADSVVDTRQSLGGEDFAWYLEQVPGAMARLGVRPPGGQSVDLHTGAFDVDERAIEVGVRVLAGTALAALRGYGHPGSAS